jgi:hypothetical protein
VLSSIVNAFSVSGLPVSQMPATAKTTKTAAKIAKSAW